MPPELIEFTNLLDNSGLHEALRFLNGRTPHRYTGVYRFDGSMLRNEYLFDRYFPDILRGDDAPMTETYCSVVGHTQQPLEIADARSDERVSFINSPVVSYCGVLVRDDKDEPFGTLCHFDINRCQPRLSDIPLLEAAAPLVFRALKANGCFYR